MISSEEPVRILDVLEILDAQPDAGLQVVLASGKLRSTKALYKSAGKYFLFDMNDDWYFTRNGGLTKPEILHAYRDSWWFVEFSIS